MNRSSSTPSPLPGVRGRRSSAPWPPEEFRLSRLSRHRPPLTREDRRPRGMGRGSTDPATMRRQRVWFVDDKLKSDMVVPSWWMGKVSFWGDLSMLCAICDFATCIYSFCHVSTSKMLQWFLGLCYTKITLMLHTCWMSWTQMLDALGFLLL